MKPDRKTQKAIGLLTGKRGKQRAPRLTTEQEGRRCDIYCPPDEELNQAFGTSEGCFSRLIVKQLGALFGSSSGLAIDDEVLNAALAAVHGVQPEDELEAMLAAQMFAAHHLAMKASSAAVNANLPSRERDAHLRHAMKLMRVFTTQIEALKRYRGKGQQRVQVEHVHIHSGAQAVVGQVGTGAHARGEGTR